MRTVVLPVKIRLDILFVFQIRITDFHLSFVLAVRSQFRQIRRPESGSYIQTQTHMIVYILLITQCSGDATGIFIEPGSGSIYGFGMCVSVIVSQTGLQRTALKVTVYICKNPCSRYTCIGQQKVLSGIGIALPHQLSACNPFPISGFRCIPFDIGIEGT